MLLRSPTCTTHPKNTRLRTESNTWLGTRRIAPWGQRLRQSSPRTLPPRTLLLRSPPWLILLRRILPRLFRPKSCRQFQCPPFAFLRSPRIRRPVLQLPPSSRHKQKAKGRASGSECRAFVWRGKRGLSSPLNKHDTCQVKENPSETHAVSESAHSCSGRSWFEPSQVRHPGSP